MSDLPVWFVFGRGLFVWHAYVEAENAEAAVEKFLDANEVESHRTDKDGAVTFDVYPADQGARFVVELDYTTRTRPAPRGLAKAIAEARG